MKIELWPIAGRAQLVQAFRPGELASKEAPFRTLRAHGWATSGVNIVTRRHQRASGRITIFSALNVQAARCARDGEMRRAIALAKAAAQVEKSAGFTRLKELLSGENMAAVSAAIEGNVTRPELQAVLRLIARETRRFHARGISYGTNTEVVVGKVMEALDDVIVVQAETGERTLVPRWLAESAHRDRVGDLLALVSDRLDATQMVVKAVPAIESGEVPSSPFGRRAAVREVTAADARLLSRSPAALRILVPVAIEE